MPTENQKQPFIDRLIGYISPRAASERAYWRGVQRQLPGMMGTPTQDDGPLPRNYSREPDTSGPPQANAVYGSASASRVDRTWPVGQALRGINSPLNRWRLMRLRDRSQELDRNNVLVTGMLDRAAENVIGHGMRVRPTTDDPAFNAQVEELWGPWIEQADITGERGAAEFQRLLHRCKLRDGDVGINLVSCGSDAYLQAIEGGLIDTLNGGYDLSQNVINGIQFNDDGRPIAYNVLSISQTGAALDSRPIPARNFVFLARRKGFLETRGEPCFVQVDRLFDQIDGYVEASVIAARVAACQSLMIKKRDGGKITGNLPTQLNAKNNAQKLQSMEPGMVHYLQADEDVQTVAPNQPTQTFESFLSMLLRFTGLSLGLPLELVFLDFSRTTYSSARASLLQSYRTFRSEQQIFIDRVMSRIYRWRVSKWVKDGTIKPSVKLLGNPDQGIAPSYWKHEWIAPGWAWIDPVKEIQAAMMEVDAGFNSLENVCLQHGRTAEDILQSQQKTMKLAEKLGVDLSRSSLTRDAVLVPGQPPNALPAPASSPATQPEDGAVESDE